ncbi:hypothetical protein ACHQM5_020356 [Ranunculus cassubicifolius]
MATPAPPTQAAAPTQSTTGSTMKRKPVFIKVDELKPGTTGHNLTVKVVTSKTVLQKGRAASQHLRQTRIAECLVGDETVGRTRKVQLTRPDSGRTPRPNALSVGRTRDYPVIDILEELDALGIEEVLESIKIYLNR